MDIPQEIAERVESLPLDRQELVLKFIASLSDTGLVGEKGSALRPFSSSIDSDSARQMSQAIEEECERIDASEW